MPHNKKGWPEDSANLKGEVWKSVQKAEGTHGKFLRVKKNRKIKNWKTASFQIGTPEGILQKVASEAMERFRSEKLTYFKMFLSSIAVLVSLHDEFRPGPKIHRDYGVF